MEKEPLPKELLERLAQRFRVLGEPIRLELLNLLMTRGEMCVMELVQATGHQQANISKHLNLMAREGLLRRRKEGLKVYYRLDDPTLHGICMLICGRLREEMEQERHLLSGLFNLTEKK